MKRLMIAASAFAMLGGCATYGDEPAEVAVAADPSDPLFAPGYMAMAASSDMFEIESSRLALQMSRNDAVRQFAQMMINDHSRTTSELMAAAQQAGIAPPPPQMMPHHAEMLERLRAGSPADFDRRYKVEQIAAHQEALTLHRNYADRGDLAPFRAVAARAVPIVEMHFGHAQSLPETAMMMQPQPAPYVPEPAPRRAGERG